ncbi:MAG: HAMP domain-containing histidine kinase [bacterium]|nr:HAMP domain-containing histidine kinase [bacterium]
MENMKYYCCGLEYCTDFLDSIFKSYPDGIVCKDSELKYIYINNSYRKLMSVDNLENLLHFCENKFISSHNFKLINDADNEIKKNLYSLNYILNTDNRILSITSSPILRDSKFLGLFSCVKDITHEENIKENFVNKHFKHINKEKQLQAQRETFVASIGHDLKNPTIAQIRGLELLLNGSFGVLSGEQRELLTMILDSCRYMNGMLSSLLDTYRNYGGAIKLNFSEFCLNNLLNECVSEMLYVAKDKEIEFIINSNEECFINADIVQIRRVIMNLLSNAIKYAFKSTKLNLRILKEGNNVIFEFENKSPYISEEKQKMLFARYVSYANACNEFGIGLGLYASKKIIESHNGEIYVKSFKNNSNIFGFKIPINQISKTSQEIYL